MEEILNFGTGGLTGALFGMGDDGEEVIPKERQMVDEGRATLGAYRTLAPTTLAFLNDFGPQYQDAALKGVAAQVVGGERAGEAARGGSMGLFENYIAPGISRAQAAGNRSQREADVADVEALGGRATAAIRSANPQQAALLDMMNQMAREELAQGSGMDAGMRREVTQGVRAGQAARGLGVGTSDLFEESMATGEAGQRLKGRRQAFASQVAGMNQAAVGDPFMAVVGRQSMTTPWAQNQMSGDRSAAAANQPNSDPFSAYASDLYNTNYNAAWSNVFNQRNVDAARDAAMMQMIGSIVGGASGAAGAMCWVAREVYGKDDPRWKIFRKWVIWYAPARFSRWYLKRGAAYAKKVAKRPDLKAKLRVFMDSKLREVYYAV